MIEETTVALVADASRAHLFRVEVATGKWTPLEQLEHPEGRMHARDLWEATPNLDAGRFAKHVASELAHRYDERVFRRLVLVAPAEFLGMLRGELPERVSESVVEELSRDLSNLRADELVDRIGVPHA